MASVPEHSEDSISRYIRCLLQLTIVVTVHIGVLSSACDGKPKVAAYLVLLVQAPSE